MGPLWTGLRPTSAGYSGPITQRSWQWVWVQVSVPHVENGTVVDWFEAYVGLLQWTNNSEVLAVGLGPG